MTHAPLPMGVDPLAAAPVAWDNGAPVVELFDSEAGAVWTMATQTGEISKAEVPGALSAYAATKWESEWWQAGRVVDGPADTTVVISRSADHHTRHDASRSELAEGSQRTITRLLHMRPAGDRVLVTEASFPFHTVAFTRTGVELWRDSPQARDLQNLLGESELQYVISTPAIPVDDAVLTTLVALRSGRRVTALKFPGGSSMRYREIPGDLAFLEVFPKHRLLVGTRDGDRHKVLLLYRWRWIDQRSSCT